MRTYAGLFPDGHSSVLAASTNLCSFGNVGVALLLIAARFERRKGWGTRVNPAGKPLEEESTSGGLVEIRFTCYYDYMAMKSGGQSMHRYEARAAIAKALAHPSRLMILEALEQREQCVTDLTELVGADQSTVSKHLAILKQAGLVEVRKEGVMAFYRVKVCCLSGFWQCIETVLRENLKDRRAAIGR